jgi:hypothetical protein
MDWQTLADEAGSIVASARTRGATLRVVGGLGIRLHCAAVAKWMDQFGHQPKDIDLVVLKRDRRVIRQVLEELGYVADRNVLVAMEGRRYAFAHPERALDIDVFVDRLDFCHVVEIRDRLHVHPLTLPIEELLLSKLQVIKPTATDLRDMAAILLSHPVGTGADGAEILSAGQIAGILARDWGFHHTAVGNLNRLAGCTAALDLAPGDRGRLHQAVEELGAAIQAAPKKLRWRARARLGERAQWWQEVDEREDTY